MGLTPPSNGNGLWTRLILALLPLALLGLIAWGTTQANVSNLADKLDDKANRETIAAQFTDLSNQLRAMREQLDRIESKLP